ncbi:hypothetical protein [Helicobacter bilis]|uniref:hypothetical protein n=1 Tax=Helicobacter bilis TaxID=37372 RepID=UPI0025582E48|nr:hypothetical protein [Helicobacter bilis]
MSDFSKETSFCSFQGGGEGSLLKANDRADTADAVAEQQIHTCKSAKSTKKTTQKQKGEQQWQI